MSVPHTESTRSQPRDAWEFVRGTLPAEDWSARSPEPGIDLAPEPVDRALRALHRRARNRHVLVTGDRGVGRTAFLGRLARRAASHAGPFPPTTRFLWVDCSNVGPEDSRPCLETLLGLATNGTPVVLCLDGFDRLLVRPHGGTNKPFVRAACLRPELTIVGVLSRSAFEDLVAGDAELLDHFERIDVAEPSEAETLAIARHHGPRLEREFALRLPDPVVERAVALASNYCLGERHPGKAIRILERACEDVDYDRRRGGRGDATVGVADVVRVVAERTGIPSDTIAGESGRVDFRVALEESVVGQESAVAAVAGELRLVKSGLTEPGKPASVMLFAGMTGVGKTELAKRVAELYSSSRRLQGYAMGNFTEPHSVSGIIGVPPGYVGHEEGGRLVNELNADPYSVFLLDEAEKAHPNVWKPFLNLFDEGWLVDQRGTRAHADRAIFVLTTNAGDNVIAQMTRQGKPEEEIVERVKQTLAKVRVERSAQPVFTPQFLARIGRIVVFRSLDEAAMIGISRRLLDRTRLLWEQRREKRLEVADDLIDAIGRWCHASNERSGGKEGGRIVRRTIADVVLLPVQERATESPDEYARCRSIAIDLADDPEEAPSATDAVPVPRASIRFVGEW